MNVNFIFLNKIWFFHFLRSYEADQCDCNDHELSSIPTNRPCDIASQGCKSERLRLLLRRIWRAYSRNAALSSSIEPRYHTGGSTELNSQSVYGRWIPTDLLYNFFWECKKSSSILKIEADRDISENNAKYK
jgi:hypothetical protein